MKKNFLKKLAFTMAFATAFTALSPAAGVFAAAKPSLTVGKKVTLLLGTEREEHDINVKNKVKGSTYKWTTGDKAIATVNSKGVVEGKKVGSAKVTLKITLPTKKTQTLTTTVDVKDNIKEVEINNAPEAAIKVGEEKDFNRTIVSTFGGNKKAHKGAITRWEVKDAEGKATENATIDTKGVFVATEVGKYKVQAVSFQSQAKYDEYLAGKDTETARSEAVTVEVVNAIAGAKQNDLTSVDVTFGGTVTDELKGKIEVHSVVAGTKVKQTVKEVKLDATKKVATVTLWVPFTEKTEYVVSGAGEASFVAATQRVEDVASIVVVTKEAVVNETTAIDYKLLNADGVNIATDALKARVTFETNSDKAYLNGNEINMLTIGDVANVTVKFHTYEYDAEGKEIIKVQTVAPIICVAVPSVASGSINAYTVVNDNDPKFDKPVHKIALNDGGYKLFVEAVKNDANKEKVNNKGNDSLFTFSSSNENVLIVSASGELFTVAQGAVQVLVKYDNVVIGTVTISVVAKRTAVKVDLSNTSLQLSKAINENKEIKITAEDQLGVKMSGAEVKVEKLQGVGDQPLVVAVDRVTNSKGEHVLVFNGSIATAGNFQYKITVGNIVRTLSVNVSDPGTDAAVKQRLDVSTNKVDMAISSGSTSRVVAFDLYDVTAKNVDKENVTSNAKYSFEIINKKGEAVVTTSASFDLVTAKDGVWAKKETGRYTVRAWENYSDSSKRKLVDVKYFEVEDTQKTPSLSKVKEEYTNVYSIAGSVNDVFEIKLGGTVMTVKSDADVKYTGSITAGTISVSEVIVEETIGANVIRHKVAINRLVKFK